MLSMADLKLLKFFCAFYEHFCVLSIVGKTTKSPSFLVRAIEHMNGPVEQILNDWPLGKH